MREAIAACVLLAAISYVFASVPSSNFLVVAPRRLFAGKHEKIWVSFPGSDENDKSSVVINLLHPEDSSKVLSSVNFKQNDKNVKSAILEIPVTDLSRALLEVVMGSGNSKDSHSRAEVEIEHSEALTFIETDRPFYKPGELVRMRFLMLQHKLVPFTGGISQIWVESPSDVRMAQWQNVETSFGMTQLELQLSEEPVEGLWKIKLQANNISSIVTKTFEVKEYVLPKFEVLITPPDYITDSSTDLSWKVCAKYSYGKPVRGDIKFNFTFENPYFHWYRRGNNAESLHVISREEKLHKKDGCHKFELPQQVFTDQQEKHAISIKVNALVEEAGTGEVQMAEHKSSIHRTEVTMDFSGSTPYFRPYLPYYGRIKVALRNGKPVIGQEVRLTLKLKKTSHSPWTHTWNLPNHDRKNFTTDSQGFVHFVVPPQTKEIHTIFIEAAARVTPHLVDSYETFEAKQWYSPSDSYIQIVDHNTLPVKCGSMQSLEVQYTYAKNTTKNMKFFYLLQSKGEVLKQVSTAENIRDAKLRHEIRGNNYTIGKFPGQDKLLAVGKWYLKLNISSMMSPMSQLLVYHIRDDGEIVAASHKMDIRPCLYHKVSTSFLHDQTQPGGKVYLSVTPSSRSLCAITGVDKAVTFLAGDHALTQDKVFEKLKRFDIRPAPPDARSFQPCYSDAGGRAPELPVPMPILGRRKNKRSMLRPSYMGFGNTKRAFSDAGMVVLSNLEVDPSPCSPDDPERPCNPCPLYNNFPPMMQARGGLEDMNFAKMAKAVPMQTSVSFSLGDTSLQSAGMAGVGGYAASAEYDSNVVETPAVEMRSLFPETWLWELELFNNSLERTFEFETPHSITDWIVNTMCVSVMDGLGIAPPTSIKVFKPYFMDFTLPYSVKRGEILLLKVSLFNYLQHDLPIRITFGEFSGGELLNKASHSTCLGEHSSLVHEFRLNPTALGEHNISVTADIDADYPSACGPESIVNVRDGLTKTIIIKPEGFPEEITNSIFVCLGDVGEQATLSWNLELPENLVPDSARAFVSVIGDIMGPSLENLDSLVQLPMGCGEQNMILFVPNIVVLNYLNSSGQTNPQLRSNAVSNMKKGYQRELTYRHKDGSYSAFGESDREGSMWLTAFVVKSFAQASKFIFVDEKDLKMSVKWITSKQLENGCFPFVGQVFHKDMKGGLGGNESPTALSAYILISLLETGLPLDQKIISNGVYCLLGEKDPDLYTLALTTYAFSLISEREKNQDMRNKAEQYLIRLLSVAHMDKKNELRWEKPGSKSAGLSVEMTAYAILALAKLGGEENLLQALNAVRWISKQRNANGGFVSTQDTVVALEALAKYAVSVPSNDINMQLLASASEDKWSHEFSLKSETRLVLQQQSLNLLPTELTFLAKGKGCALIQSNLRYNVKTAPVSEAFNLTSSLTPVNKDKCSQLLFEANVAYNLPDGASNMAVLELELLSGYVPVKESLDKLKSNSEINLKRWDENNGVVNLYFDSLTNDELNFNFLLEQAIEVESPQPAQIKVYDYYEQELIVTKSYGLDGITCLRERLPEPIPVDEPVLEVEDVVRTDQATFVSAEEEFSDQPNKRKPADDPFENFSNVDHELAVPDGMEGVEPIRVPAPPLSTQHIHTRDVRDKAIPVPTTCPVCYQESPSDFSDMFCSSKSALKISIRSSKSAKLLTDISPRKKSRKINNNISFTFDEMCSCLPLTKDGSQVIILSTDTVIDSTSENPVVHLDQKSRVVLLSQNKGSPNIINQARKNCQ